MGAGGEEGEGRRLGKVGGVGVGREEVVEEGRIGRGKNGNGDGGERVVIVV